MRYLKTQSGFSLVETLVAIAILLLIMVGPMTISSQTAKSSSFASEQVTAFFLAQEGAELIQKARDDLLITSFADSNSDPLIFTPVNPDPWADFTNTTASGRYRNCYTTLNADGCGLEIATNGSAQASAGSDLITPIDCGSGASRDCLLYLNGSNVRSHFTYTDSSTPTLFTRKIFLTRGTNPDEVEVRSRVTWRTGSLKNEQVVEVKTRLFNIYGQ